MFAFELTTMVDFFTDFFRTLLTTIYNHTIGSLTFQGQPISWLSIVFGAIFVSAIVALLWKGARG